MKTKILTILAIVSLVLTNCKQSKNQLADLGSIREIVETRSSYDELNEEEYDSLGLIGKNLEKRFELTFPEVSFLEKKSSLWIAPTKINLRKDWTDASELIFELHNHTKSNLRFEIGVKGEVGVLSDTISLPPETTVKKVLSLLDLPLISRIDNMYRPQYIELKSLNGFPSKIEVKSLSLSFNENKDRIIMDRFGQRKNTTWKSKVSSVEDFKRHIKEENLEEQKKLNSDWDEYGGSISGPQLEGNGFYQVREIDDKYWFITPSGRLFWSFGVNGVRPKIDKTACTHISGREFLFDSVPPKQGKYSQAWTSEDEASYYCWNVLRKHGNLDGWRDAAIKRLDSWGYNTIGNWSDDTLLLNSKFPYTYSFRTTTNEDLMFGKSIPDVFSPKWIDHIDSVLSKASQFSKDPYLIGYFIDNEGGWGNLDLLKKMGDNSSSRQEWLAFLQKKYKSIDLLNNSWVSTFKDWEDVKFLRINLDSGDFKKDKIEFEALFAEQYFSSVKRVLQKYDPNHLYLGCRFTRRIKPEYVCRAAGKYCDVVTVNVYSRAPTKEIMHEWYKRTGKPILIGEHHINLASQRQVPAKWGASTPADRREYYTTYVKTWANTPYSLGCHWYQYTDQHITGRGSNGENQNIGLVDITDQPHVELIETARDLSKSIYEMHMK